MKQVTVKPIHYLSIISLSFSTIAIFPLRAIAQSTPPAGVTLPPNTPGKVEQTIPQPAETPPLLPPPTSSPPVPLPIPENQPSLELPAPSSVKLPVKTIEVLGNTVLKQEINAEVQKFLKDHKQGTTFEELVALRSAITQLYLNNDYVTSGAFILNNQPLSSGIIQIQVVEGEVERIDVEGLTHLQPGYIRSRLASATQVPLSRRRLETALQLLQIDPLLQQVNAELTAGSVPGRNILKLRLKESPPFHIGINIGNSQSPSVGSIQGNVFASHDNVLGIGDRFNADYGRTEGLNLYSFGYTVPFNARNGTISLSYSQNRSQIIEDPFGDLGIRSNSRTFSVNVRQPLVRSPQTEFALSLALDLRRSQTFLLNDMPFSFSEGPQNGLSKVTAIRFSQDWVNRGAKRVLAARSQFSLGINALGATINDTTPDGRFFAWLGQFQWVQQLSPRALLVTQVAAQLTPDSLLSLERFSLGGVDTVRGYRENQLVSDNGILGSVELRVPLTYDPKVLQLTPFVELGSGWNTRGDNPNPSTIASLGLGLRWQVGTDLSLRLDYGIPLIHIDNKENSLQDNGLYFSLRYQPL